MGNRKSSVYDEIYPKQQRLPTVKNFFFYSVRESGLIRRIPRLFIGSSLRKENNQSQEIIYLDSKYYENETCYDFSLKLDKRKAFQIKIKRFSIKDTFFWGEIQSKPFLDQLQEIDELIQREYNFQHKNILDCYGYIITNEKNDMKIGILLEKFETRLIDRIEGSMKGYETDFSHKEKLKILRDICNVMMYLHEEKKVIHNNLKSNRIYLTKDNSVRITNEKEINTKEIRLGTLTYGYNDWYKAPETNYSSRRYEESEYSDVFSFSMIMYELLETTTIPFGEYEKHTNIEREIHFGIRPKLEDGKIRDPELKKIIKRCWSKSPKKRPRFRDLYKFFSEKIDPIMKFRRESLNEYKDCVFSFI